MVDAEVKSTAAAARSEWLLRRTYGPALGLLALGAFIGSWFSPWVRSIGIAGFSTATVGDIQYVLAHVAYAPATGPVVVWVLLFVLFVVGVASLWSRTRLVAAVGAIASVVVAVVLIATAGRVGPDAHATVIWMSADPITWDSRLQPSGWLAFGATALLVLLTIAHLAAGPWARRAAGRNPIV
jgi:hypothetical protein